MKAFVKYLLCAEGALRFTLHSTDSLIKRLAQNIFSENVLCFMLPPEFSISMSPSERGSSSA